MRRRLQNPSAFSQAFIHPLSVQEHQWFSTLTSCPRPCRDGRAEQQSICSSLTEVRVYVVRIWLAVVAESPEISTSLGKFPNQSCCQHRLLLPEVLMCLLLPAFSLMNVLIMFRSLHGSLCFFLVGFQGKTSFIPRETLGYMLRFQCALPLGVALALDLGNSCNEDAGLWDVRAAQWQCLFQDCKWPPAACASWLSQYKPTTQNTQLYR